MTKRPLMIMLTALMFIGLYATGAMAGQTYTDSDINGGDKTKKEKKAKKNKRRLGLQHPSDQKIYFSGEHNGNRHVVMLKNPGMEIVIGHITAMSSRGIIMDGVYYDLGGVELVDNYMRAATVAELYVGLKVNLKFFYGSLEKVTVYDLFRGKTLTLSEEAFKKIVEGTQKDGQTESGRGGK